MNSSIDQSIDGKKETYYKSVLHDLLNVLPRLELVISTKQKKRKRKGESNFTIPYITLCNVLENDDLILKIKSHSHDNSLDSIKNIICKYFNSIEVVKKLEDRIRYELENDEDYLIKVLDRFKNCNVHVSSLASQSSKEEAINTFISSNTSKVYSVLCREFTNFKCRDDYLKRIPHVLQLRMRSNKWVSLGSIQCLELSIVLYQHLMHGLYSEIKKRSFEKCCELFGYDWHFSTIIEYYIQLSHKKTKIYQLNHQYIKDNTRCGDVNRIYKKIKLYKNKSTNLIRNLFPSDVDVYSKKELTRLWKDSMKSFDVLGDLGCTSQQFVQVTPELLEERFPWISNVKNELSIFKALEMKLFPEVVTAKRWKSYCIPSPQDFEEMMNDPQKGIEINIFKWFLKTFKIGIVYFKFHETNNEISIIKDDNNGTQNFVFVSKSGQFNMTQLRVMARIERKIPRFVFSMENTSNIFDWIKSFHDYNPKFSDIWNEFATNGVLVHPIIREADNLRVGPFWFRNIVYKKYIEGMKITEDEIYKDGIYKLQIQDAYNCVKRMDQKSRDALHHPNDYEEVVLAELLQSISITDIYKLVLSARNHGIYPENVYPFFDAVDNISQKDMFDMFVVSGRFSTLVRGYTTTNTSVVYKSQVYNEEIDVVHRSPKGYIWEDIHFSKQSIEFHELCVDDVTFLEAVLYTHENVKVRVNKQELKKYRKTQFLSKEILQNFEPSVCELFFSIYLSNIGPFGLEKSDILTKEVFDVYCNRNTNEIKQFSEYIRRRLVDHQRIYIDVCEWNYFIRELPKNQTYIKTKALPKVPCYVQPKQDMNQHGNGVLYCKHSPLVNYPMGEYILESCNPAKDQWIVAHYYGLQIRAECRMTWKRKDFKILRDRRCLPAKVKIFKQKLDNIGFIVSNNKNSSFVKGVATEYNSKEDVYDVVIGGERITLKYKTDFIWAQGLWLEEEETGEGIENTDLQEEKAFKKGFHSRNLAQRQQNYHVLYRDAALPSEIKGGNESVVEDDGLCHFLGKKSKYSIFPFIRFTELRITNEELYDLYYRVKSDHLKYQTMTQTFEQNLKRVVKVLWKEMTQGRWVYDVSTTIHKIEGLFSENADKICDIGQSLSNIEELYLVIIRYLYE